MRGLLFLGLSFAAFTVPAQDSPGDQLREAKKAYDKLIDDAKTSLLDNFEKAVKTAQDQASQAPERAIADVQKLNDEKKAFQDDGTLPRSARMKSAVQEFNRAVEVADKALEREYDKAMAAYTRAGQPDQATSVLTEKKKFLEELEEKRFSRHLENLYGTWRVRMGPTYRTQWVFDPDGTVTSSDGAPKGSWRYEKEKKRILINWDGTNEWDSLRLPITPRETKGETSHGKGWVVIAVKIKS